MKTKQCKKCNKELPLHKFYEYTATDGRGPYYHSRCRDCYNKYQRQISKYSSVRQNSFNRHLQREYGITLAEYEILLNAQNGKCAICGQLEIKKDKNGNIQPLSVDHCHKSYKIRALLCHNCNIVLGYAKDDPETLRKAADYLEKYQ